MILINFIIILEAFTPIKNELIKAKFFNICYNQFPKLILPKTNLIKKMQFSLQSSNLQDFNITKNELVTKAKICRICYGNLNKYNIIRIQTLHIYTNYFYITDPKTKSACYIFYNNNQIDVCFKGTSTFNDICLNFDIYPRRFINNNIRIHNGFLKKYISMKKEIIKTINIILQDTKNNITEISFNGHSAGGAIANIASLDLSYIYNNLMIKCITFGAPRVGNKNFIDEYNKRIKKSIRIVNENDIITHVPFPIIYTHIHKPIKLVNTNTTIVNFNWNIVSYFKSVHSIINYIRHL